MRRVGLVFAGLATLVACGSAPDSPDVRDPVDAALDATAPEAAALDATAPDAAGPGPEVVFAVSVIEWVSSKGGVDSAHASASRAWSWDEAGSTVAATAGDCRLVLPTAPPLCEPPCAPGTICVADPSMGLGADGTCAPAYQALGAGDIVLAGLKVGCTLHPETEYHYYASHFAPEPAEGDVFDEGDVLTATAPGDDVPPFSVPTRGVARVDPSLACPPDLPPGQGLDLTWTPGAQAGDRISFTLQSGNHGSQFARILCDSADVGSLHVDASLVDPWMEERVPVYSWRMTRWHEEGVDVPGVRVTFTAASHTGCMW